MFGFPQVTKEIYPKTFLNKVFFGLQFPHISDLRGKEKEIRNLFGEILPRTTFGKNQGFQLSFEDGTQPDVKSVGTEDNVTLKSFDGQEELFIDLNGIRFSIDGKKYKNYQDSTEEVFTNLNSLFEILGVSKLNHCTIRKINIADFGYTKGENSPNGVLQVLLNDSISSSEDAYPKPESITQNMRILNFKDADYALNVRYGMSASQSSVDNKGRFVLDLRIDLLKEITPKELRQEFIILNNELYNAFSWFLSDKTKTLLRDGKIK